MQLRIASPKKRQGMEAQEGTAYRRGEEGCTLHVASGKNVCRANDKPALKRACYSAA